MSGINSSSGGGGNSKKSTSGGGGGTTSSSLDKEKGKIEKQQQAVIKEIEKKEKERRKEEKRDRKEKERQEKREKRRSGSFSLRGKKVVSKGKGFKGDGSVSNGGSPGERKSRDFEKEAEKEAFQAEGGIERSPRDGKQDSDLIKILERLKNNDKALTVIDNPSIVREIHVVGKDFIKIVSDCLVFNTHLNSLDLSGCEITLKQAELLGEALKVNSTLEFINLSYNNLGDAGVAALAPGFGENEGTYRICFLLSLFDVFYYVAQQQYFYSPVLLFFLLCHTFLFDGLILLYNNMIILLFLHFFSLIN